MNYAQSVDPDAPINENPDISAANNNYASLLMFLKNNPSKAGGFIKDIREKFFHDSCTVKTPIRFEELTSFPDGPVFT